MYNIVVLDDDKEIADLITLYLKNENFNVNTFYSANIALQYLKSNSPDLLLLDIMMPDVDGISVIQEVRKNEYYPVIFITAKDSELDILNGLTVGGDGYITKPFKPLELVARIKAVLRMKMVYEKSNEEINVFKYKDMSLDYNKRKCIMSDKDIELTSTEFEILKILSENIGKALSSEEIFKELTGDDYYGKACNSVATHIRNIRIKINDSFENPEYVKTIWGKGYVLEENN